MKKLWFKTFSLSIIISIVFKIIQVIDRIYNVVILNLYKHDSNNYRKQIHFISAELKIETVVLYVTYILFIILFSGWMYIQYKEAHRQSRIKLTYKPVWALFSFIIPIFNLIAPYKIMNDLWTVYNRDMSIEMEGRNLIKTWWFLSIGLFIFRKFISIKFTSASTLDEVINEECFFLILYAISIHYYFIVRKLVNSINNSR
jgi:hypothetical protein